MVDTDSIVFGAAGFIGRSLVAELLRDGHTVTAAVRAGSQERLRTWLTGQGVDQGELTIVDTDIAESDLALRSTIGGVRDVYNAAALMKFGLEPDAARRVNVTGALNVLTWASRQPELRRVVHITAYRATVEGGLERDYRNGAYGASKLEADAALRELAAAQRIPLTIANPSSVLGPGQYFGLAEVVDNLWNGKLPALPGRSDTFIPVVDVDYVARFLVGLPTLPDTVGRAYTLLDPATPDLPDLIRLIADHLHVPAPRFSVPVSLLRALPRALTKADPETLMFIASDRYDTTAADDVARRLGIAHPPVGELLRGWTDGIVATRYGAAPESAAGFSNGTWVSGDTSTPKYVLLHGLPIDSDGWNDVVSRLDAPVLAADLPGVGRSAARPDSMVDWLDELLATVRTRPVLVAHSLGTEPAVRYALRHPDRISRLVLISPAFLQSRASWLTRSRIIAEVMKRLPVAKLAEQLGVPNSPAIESAAANLRRPGVARRTVAALAAASAPKNRTALAAELAQLRVPFEIIAGSDDPVTTPTTYPVTIIEGTGHYPQLTHPEIVAGLLIGGGSRTAPSEGAATTVG
ncbi:alpha/beta fold hydrolase [Nocardia sp. NBC_01327]|uniref:alpha/beta fold hydrolase n=1 Tax=Nocardia sp. NBC_01327 TaxID=2903593 RepID=UPI002E104664|nr:alpha/beta fold hydrolase [Nocardia sp. NBC_01327]